MKKRSLLFLTILSLILCASFSLAQEIDTPAPAITLSEDQQRAADVLLLEYPNAQIDLVLASREDGRKVWEIFFVDGDSIGECVMRQNNLAILSVRLYDLSPDDLLPSEIVDILREKKGDITVQSLEIERDDGRLHYEGEAKISLRSYDFEITFDGRITEWDRD